MANKNELKELLREVIREEFGLNRLYPEQNWAITAHHAIDELNKLDTQYKAWIRQRCPKKLS